MKYLLVRVKPNDIEVKQLYKDFDDALCGLLNYTIKYKKRLYLIVNDEYDDINIVHLIKQSRAYQLNIIKKSVKYWLVEKNNMYKIQCNYGEHFDDIFRYKKFKNLYELLERLNYSSKDRLYAIYKSMNKDKFILPKILLTKIYLVRKLFLSEKMNYYKDKL